jgi:hypothetical protein
MKLSDFKDEEAIEVISDLLAPIERIATNKNTATAKGGTVLSMARAMMKNNAAEVKEILAIMNRTEPEEYHCTAASVLKDLMELLSDTEFLRLFGVQSQTQTSAGSALESSEVSE